MLSSSDYNYFLFINCHDIVECVSVRKFALWLTGKMFQVWTVLRNNLCKNSMKFLTVFHQKCTGIEVEMLEEMYWFWQTLIGKSWNVRFWQHWFIFFWLKILISAIGILNIICTYNLHLSVCSSCSIFFLSSKARLTKSLQFLTDVAQPVQKVLKSSMVSTSSLLWSLFCFQHRTKMYVWCSKSWWKRC